MNEIYDTVVIGAGPAGLAAALSAAGAGAGSVLVLERDEEPGGILRQCIHNGFGTRYFKEELTGCEYADRFIESLKKDQRITLYTGTTILEACAANPVKKLTTISKIRGVEVIKTKTLVFAMGCRERTRGMIRIPGTRPAGVYTAGTAQKLVNMHGLLPGKKAVILGSGDIGLIMARRLTLEGATVPAVVEIMPWSNGLKRNIVQCLEDYNIPLLLGFTILEIHGRERVEGVTLIKVDRDFNPLSGTEKEIACDTVLLSVGLIPENEISRGQGVTLDRVTNGPVVTESRQTSIPGCFACGNVVHVHDLVDNVTLEAEIAGRSAGLYARGLLKTDDYVIKTHPGAGISYVVPQRVCPVNLHDRLDLFFRVRTVMKNVRVRIAGDLEERPVILYEKKHRVLLPAEMEQISLGKSEIMKLTDIDNIQITVLPADLE